MRFLPCALLAVLVQFVPTFEAHARAFNQPIEQVGGGFSPAIFKFVTDLPDKGTGAGGGWQVAVATLKFFDIRHLLPDAWTCKIRVGMPLRTKLRGVVTPASAAIMSAASATSASKAIMHQRPRWIAALFCIEFRAAMEADLNASNPGLGARVERL